MKSDLALRYNRKKLIKRLNAAAALLAVVVIFVEVNYLAFAKYSRFDFTRARRFTVSERMKRLLGSLDGDLKIIYIGSPSPNNVLYWQAQDIASELAKYAHRLELEVTDPYAHFGRMAEHVAKYGIRREDTVTDLIVVEYEKDGESRYKLLRERNFSIPDPHASAVGPDGRPAAIIPGDLPFYTAIRELSLPSMRRVYFTTGHGELSTAEEKELYAFSRVLSTEGYFTSELDLRRENTIPADCKILIIAGPQGVAFTPGESKAIEDYLDGGGRLLALLDPFVSKRTEVAADGARPKIVVVFSSDGLEGLLAGWRIRAPSAVLMDPGSTRTGDTYDQIFYQFLREDIITRGLGNEATLFSGVRPVLVARAALEGVVAEDFLNVTDKSYLETRTNINPASPVYKQKYENAGEGKLYSFGVRSVKDGGEGGNVIVIGDADFARTDSLKTYGANLVLLLNCVNWLAGEEMLNPDDFTVEGEPRFNIVGDETNKLERVLMIYIPALFFLLGIVVWFIRRN